MSARVLVDRYPAPCLTSGPLSPSARIALSAAQTLGRSGAAAALRAWSVPFLFDEMERVFNSGEPPTPGIVSALERLAECFAVAAANGFADIGPGAVDEDDGQVEELAPITGAHYGRLFREFSTPAFWQEPAGLLGERLTRNGIEPSRWRDRSVLDAGCGGGRYSVAWRLLGAESVIGLDISETGIANARGRVQEAGINGVSFQTGNVLSLPFEAERFDVVCSNGVLHHTTDWEQGVKEAVRVLRPGGLGWLYLIENPGGLFWDVVEILRQLMRGEPREAARQRLALLGLPANRVFYMLDHVMVPINIRLTPQEVEDCLRDAGATEIQRLTRGVAFDRVEAIHRGDPYAVEKYGVGENRYVFSK